MCGIAGVAKKSPITNADVDQAEKMGNILAHRGPDSRGLRTANNYVFAHHRLSIIDIDHGNQPMSNESETIWLVYNGEIYNFQELRGELQEKGHRFRTRCDTEVIIHLYEEFGDECVTRLNGMFAFAIFDERKQRLLMARDRSGIKPLYYIFESGALRFASEAKALVQTSPRLVGPDHRSIVDFFSLSVIQEDRTAFEGVVELQPAHSLTWNMEGVPCVSQYWRPSYESKINLTSVELTTAVSDLLGDAVRSHLISDVPVGTYLSGGLDSSLVSVIANEYLPELNTFSAGFVGKEQVDERRYAREAAAAIGSFHHEVEVEPGNFLKNLQKIIWHMDEPTLSPGVYPYYFLCGLVAESVKVVLGGQGSDEMFGGYPRYRMAILEKKIISSLKSGHLSQFLSGLNEYRRRYGKGALKNELRRLNMDEDRRIFEIVSGFHPRRLSKLFSSDFQKALAGYDPWETFQRSLENCDSDDLIDRMLYNDFHNMLPSILRTEDRMSMAHSIESRVPFLDNRLIDFAASIESAEKVVGDEPKWILKRAAAGRVPQSIIERSKQGFSAPIDSWFSGALQQEIRQFLLGERTRSRGYFSMDYIEQVVSRSFNKRKDIWRMWSLVTFEMWCRVFIDGEVGTD